MIVGILDCETTGISQKDEIITLALIYGEVDVKGHFLSTTEWYGERCPNVEISREAYRIHGRTMESLQGKSLDLDDLKKVIDGIDVLIAHNCRFDARMLAQLLPEVWDKKWRCSYKQWVWPDMKNQKMDTVCDYYQIDRPKHHNALDDTRDLIKCLLKHSGKTERSKTFLKKLLERHDFYLENEKWKYGTDQSSRHLHSTVVIDLGAILTERENELLREENEQLKQDKKSSEGRISTGGALIILFLVFMFFVYLVRG